MVSARKHLATLTWSRPCSHIWSPTFTFTYSHDPNTRLGHLAIQLSIALVGLLFTTGTCTAAAYPPPPALYTPLLTCSRG